MIESLYVLGITPARAGSKRVKGKNTRSIGGRPLLSFAIDTLVKSAYVDAVILSTDDAKMAEVGAAYGAETPELRPAELSNDKARLFDVFSHELHAHEKRSGRRVDIVVSVQASAPLVTTATIDALVELCAQPEVSACGTTTLIQHGHPYIARARNANGELVEYLDLPAGTPRYPSQSRPNLEYFDGCAFARRRHMLTPPDPTTNALGPRPHGLRIEEQESVNIDTEFDLQLAELLLEKRNQA